MKRFEDLAKLRCTMLAGSVRLKELREHSTLIETKNTHTRTLDVRDVSPAEFSLVCRPLCGPGLGFSFFLKASRSRRVVSGVRSSRVDCLNEHIRERRSWTDIKVVVND